MTTKLDHLETKLDHLENLIKEYGKDSSQAKGFAMEWYREYLYNGPTTGVRQLYYLTGIIPAFEKKDYLTAFQNAAANGNLTECIMIADLFYKVREWRDSEELSNPVEVEGYKQQ